MLNHSDLVRDGAIEAGPVHGACAGDGLAKLFGWHLGIQVTVVQPVMAVRSFHHLNSGIFSSRLGKRAGDMVQEIVFFRHRV